MGNLIGNNLHVAGTHTLHSRCKDEIEIHWTYVKKEQKKLCLNWALGGREKVFSGDS